MHDKICHLFAIAFYPGLGRVLRPTSAGRLTLTGITSRGVAAWGIFTRFAAMDRREALSPLRHRGHGGKKEKKILRVSKTGELPRVETRGLLLHLAGEN